MAQISSDSDSDYEIQNVIKELLVSSPKERQLDEGASTSYASSNYHCITNIEVEEVDESKISQNELNEFEDAVPMVLCNEEIVSDEPPPAPITAEEEAVLINKLVDGQLTVTEFNKKIGLDMNTINPQDFDETIEVETVNDDVEMEYGTELDVEEREAQKLKIADDFFAEYDKQRLDMFRGKIQSRTVERDGKRVRKRVNLPPALQGLIGQANLSLVRGETQACENACREIIRQCPLAPDAFHTLANLYENVDWDKYINYALITAHLECTNIELWTTIAENCAERGNLRQAINCYSKAIQYSKDAVELKWKRIQLLKQLGDDRLVFRAYCRLLPTLPSDDDKLLLDITLFVAKQLYKERQYKKAKEHIESTYERISHAFKDDDIHLFIEILLANKDYLNVIDVLESHCDIKVIKEIIQDPPSVIIKSYDIPDSVNIDFRTKCIISIIHLKPRNLMSSLRENLMDHIKLEDASDCYFSVADAFITVGEYGEAAIILKLLLETDAYQELSKVWQKYADCQHHLGNIEEAVTCYRKVVAMAPQHFESRLTLATLLKIEGNLQESLDMLDQDFDAELINSRVLYERIFLMKELNRPHMEVLNAGIIYYSRYFTKLRNHLELKIIGTMVKQKSIKNYLMEIRKSRKEPIDEVDRAKFKGSSNDPSVEDEFNLFKSLIQLAFDKKEIAIMSKMTFEALCCARFQQYYSEIAVMAAYAGYYNRFYSSSYDLIKMLILKDTDNNKLWNMMNVIFGKCLDNRFNRFITRLMDKTELNRNIVTLRANWSLMAGTFKYALIDYTSLLKSKETRSPMMALLVAITYLRMSLQKYMANRQSMGTQALAFMGEYSEMRIEEAPHEIDYNMGRFYHGLGLNHMAMSHYKRVLEYKSQLVDDHSDHLSLKNEAAYNIHLLYLATKNYTMARKYLFMIEV